MTPHTLELELFGRLALKRDNVLLRLPTRKAELLLVYLALHPGEHLRQELAALFWGDAPDAPARRSLRVALARVRQACGADVVIATDDTLELNPAYPLYVDALDFETRILGRDLTEPFSMRNNDTLPPALADKARALNLYRGELLPGFYDDWILTRRERLRELYLTTLLELADFYRARGDYAQSLQYARHILETDKANEAAHRHVIFSLFQTGDRDAALRQYDECVRVLADELNVAPSSDTIALYQHIKVTPTQARTWIAPNTNLPVRTRSFIGRAREMEQLRALLLGDATRGMAPAHVLTLVGPGGCGKTRLALETARTLTDAFPDGVWWIELAALNQDALVAQTAARVIGANHADANALDSLIEYLTPRRTLLILDNCEHLIDACAQLADAILQHCPYVQIMATSREALALNDEIQWTVPSLGVPKRDAPLALEQLQTQDSIRLFIERARAVKNDFALIRENAPAVAQICRHLDGIPLAIELAAVRVKVLSPQQIAARLNDVFDLLTQGNRMVLPRQQTLRALIDWSYDLLEPHEQILFQRLAVFVGGSTLDSAVPVCAGAPLTETAILDLLVRLNNKSLLMRRDEEPPRYVMLETMRQYALSKLAASEQNTSAHKNFLAYWLREGKRLEPELIGAQQADWLNYFEREHDNVRAALEWGIANAPDDALALAAAIWRFWFARGYYAEGRQWLERALNAAPAKDAPRATRAKALNANGLLARTQSDLVCALRCLNDAHALYQALGDEAGIAIVRSNMGLAELDCGHYAEARTHFQAMLDIRRAQADTWGTAIALNNLGLVAMQLREYADAEPLFQESLQLLRVSGNRQWFVAASLYNNSLVAMYRGELGHATELCEASLELRRALGDKHGIGESLKTLGEIAYRNAQYARAKTLYGEALEFFMQVQVAENIVECIERRAAVDALHGDAVCATEWLAASETRRKGIGIPLRPTDTALVEHAQNAVRARLSQTEFDAAWKRGKLRVWDDIVQAARTNA